MGCKLCKSKKLEKIEYPIPYISRLNEDNILNEDKNCNICHIKKNNILNPCSHLNVCEECANNIELCPICCQKLI